MFSFRKPRYSFTVLHVNIIITILNESFQITDIKSCFSCWRGSQGEVTQCPSDGLRDTAGTARACHWPMGWPVGPDETAQKLSLFNRSFEMNGKYSVVFPFLYL